MLNRIAFVLAGSAALAVILLAPSAVGSSSAVAPGEIVSASFRSATLGEELHYNVYLPAGYAASAERYPVLYLLHGRGDRQERLDADAGRARRADRLRRDPADDRDHARRPVEQPRELLRRLGVHRRRPGPQGRDGVHEGSDRARRQHLPDGGEPHRPGRRRLLDGWVRRPAVLPRPPRSVRRLDRAQPGGLRPGSADGLEYPRVRRLRARKEPLRRLDLPEAELSRAPRALRGNGALAADVHRGRRRRVQEHRAQGLRARPRLRGRGSLQPGRAHRERDERVPRRRRRPRLGCLGPDLRRGREVHLPVPQSVAGDA